uniref:Strawberry notch AAA domain-containing protein n=1 Tax=Guillardia theta (strain CCMP2712) TaxID=905079 RepID=A0A0C3TLL1_GUITC
MPDPITETSTLSSIIPPKWSIKLRLPEATIKEGRLTNLQLESVIYACEQHERMIPGTQYRSGFFMGDGPGVGKGRQIAGIILENFIRGRKRAIWISISSDLIDDAKRDICDIGGGAIPIHDLRDYGNNKDLNSFEELNQGVIFCTYSLLVRNGAGGGKDQSRLTQIVKWAGEDFDGVLAFDEAHKAKNIRIPKKGRHKLSQALRTNGTKSATAVIEIQQQLPLARVVYVSATGASEPEHLLYASRLGLWGPGTSFDTPDTFVREIRSGGTGAMELLAMELKQLGQYLARSLSFKGAEFEVVEEEIDQEFMLKYDKAVELWSDIISHFSGFCKKGIENLTRKEINQLRSQLWGANQRFWGQICMAAKVKGVVRIANEAIQQGKCVVIGLQNTGESVATEEESGCSAACNLLKNFIEKFGVKVMTTEEKEQILERIDALQLPINPLDEIIDLLGGPKRVAEMTGRSVRQVCVRGEWTLVKRIKSDSSGDAINIRERKKFMSGKKLVAIISEAASTGISLHADRRVKNTRRRVHITLQLPWSADRAVQQMGRSHRSNQSSAPEFKLIMTPIGGEWRFASAVAERLQQLGAMTQGDRRATGGSGLTNFAIDPRYGPEALEKVFNCLSDGSLPPFAEDAVNELEFLETEYENDFEKFATVAMTALQKAGMFGHGDSETFPTVNVFLNRLFGVKLCLQGQIFSFWHVLMEILIRDAKMRGEYQDGITDIASELKLKDEEILHQNPATNAHTSLLTLWGDRGVSWEEAKEFLDSQNDEVAGFYKKKDPQNDAFYNIILALAKKQEVHGKRRRIYHTTLPHAGHRPEEVSNFKLRNDYDKLDLEEAEKIWKEIYEYSKDHCGHSARSSSCKGKDVCVYKKRMYVYNILTGSVFPFWEEIKKSVAIKNPRDDEFSVKVSDSELSNAVLKIMIRLCE